MYLSYKYTYFRPPSLFSIPDYERSLTSMVRVRSYCACARAAKHIASCALGLSFFSSLVGQTKLEKKIDQLLLLRKKLPNLGNKMEFGFPGHVLTLDSILEGILQDESTSSSSSDSSRPTHLSLDNIPDALPIKEEKEEGNTVDIMVRFLTCPKKWAFWA